MVLVTNACEKGDTMIRHLGNLCMFWIVLDDAAKAEDDDHLRHMDAVGEEGHLIITIQQ